jgi:DNA repair protein RecO (recombination protein O)
VSDQITVQGMVLSTMPIGENDKRLVILTRELGCISTFARGARRPGSTLMAASNPFVTGKFTLIQGRNSYSLIAADVMDYFTELATEQPGVYYGYYFLDFAAYYGRENIDCTEMLNLLYVSMKAILRRQMDRRLIRRIFEIRIMTINGEYALDEETGPETRYVIDYIMHAPLTKLYTFSVTPEVQNELDRNTEKHISVSVDRPLKSRKILEVMTS